ncbi:uncharacterized protein ColSpa_06049 [Colletotrichum spaethianum]|uniref:Uncharacterized protein n=1 Tax=Colletotrichum spaethianum TaxID=700344 RepID=A0AA37LCH3_9PEZI|nr:uncharacterized protein ColSpa_06049 [Colletotrichum spaethianum]GKT45868.1 hypothetical protein ColSpa_06049 [Colletotrichum spaethianum]
MTQIASCANHSPGHRRGPVNPQLMNLTLPIPGSARKKRSARRIAAPGPWLQGWRWARKDDNVTTWPGRWTFGSERRGIGLNAHMRCVCGAGHRAAEAVELEHVAAEGGPGGVEARIGAQDMEVRDGCGCEGSGDVLGEGKTADDV